MLTITFYEVGSNILKFEYTILKKLTKFLINKINLIFDLYLYLTLIIFISN